MKSALLSSALALAASGSLAAPQESKKAPEPTVAIKACDLKPGLMPGGCDWPGKPPRELYPFHAEKKVEGAQANASSPATNSISSWLSGARFTTLGGHGAQAGDGKVVKVDSPAPDVDKAAPPLPSATPANEPSGSNK